MLVIHLHRNENAPTCKVSWLKRNLLSNYVRSGRALNGYSSYGTHVFSTVNSIETRFVAIYVVAKL